MADETKLPPSGSMPSPSSPPLNKPPQNVSGSGFGTPPPKPSTAGMAPGPSASGLPPNLPIKNMPSAPTGPFGTDIKIKPPVSSPLFPPTFQASQPSIPPIDKQGAGSPVSPPLQDFVSQNLGGQAPKIPTPPPVKPSMPMQPPSPRQDPALSTKGLGPSRQAPVTKPFTMPSPTAPTSPAVPPSPERPTTPSPIFKSSIRTMQDDLAALKKGQQPTGAKLEKQSEKDVKLPSESGLKIIPPPARVGPKVELGKLEKARPMFGGLGSAPPEIKKEEKPSPLSIFGLGKAKPSKEAPLPPPGTAIKIPEKEGPLGRWSNIAIDVGGKKKLLLIALGGIAAVTILIFWVFRNVFDAGDVTFSPTPTPTVTASPTTTLAPLENYFSIVESLNIALGPEFLTVFEAEIDEGKIMSAKVPALYRMLDAAGFKRHGFRDVMDTLLIQPPTGIQNALADKDFYLTAFYKNDGEIGYGFIAKVNDVNTAKTALNTWEANVTDALKDFFQFDDEDAASTVFLDNTHKGVAIRYRNFPRPSLTIDYAIVNALNGSSYLVFTNSREHIYSIIDRIK